MALAPSTVMRGLAQWWPARTQTPCLVEDLGDVVRMDLARLALEDEREHPASLGGLAGAVDGDLVAVDAR